MTIDYSKKSLKTGDKITRTYLDGIENYLVDSAGTINNNILDITSIKTNIGDKENLNTSDKTNIVNAINEHTNNIKNHSDSIDLINTSLSQSMQQLVESTGSGIVSGGKVTAQSTPNMTVNVDNIVFHKSDDTRLVSSGNNTLAITASDTQRPRKDIIYMKADGTIGYLVGNYPAVHAGKETYTITTNAVVGDTIIINSITFTAVASGATGNQFNIGVDTTSTATNLANALNTNATINALFTATSNANIITLTENTAGQGNAPTIAVTNGTIVITNGTISASNTANPVAPNTPLNSVLLSIINVDKNITYITDAMIDDKRILKNTTDVLASTLSSKTNLTNERLLKSMLYSSVEKTDIGNNYGRDVVYYQAVVKNPIGVLYTNMPIGLKIKFDKGECPTTAYILVKNSSGTLIPFQWEGEIHPNYLLANSTNLATYSDGSLNAGTIWIMDTLGSSDTNTYTIEIHSTTQTQINTDNCPLTNDGTKDTITAGTTAYQFDANTGGYHIRRIFENGIEFGRSASLAVYPFYKTTLSLNDITLTSTNCTCSKATNGNGVVYKDYVVTNILTTNNTITFTTVYRVYANGMLAIDTRMVAKSGTSDTSIQGFGLKFKALETIKYTSLSDNVISNGMYGSNSSGGLMYKIFNANLSMDTIDSSSSYNALIQVDGSVSNAYVNTYWYYNTEKHLNPNSLFYIKALFTPITVNTDATAYSNMLNNMLSVHATKYNSTQLTKKYLSLCKKLADHLESYDFTDTLFPALASYRTFAHNKLNDIITSSNNSAITNYLSVLTSIYGTCTAGEFANIWKNFKGIELIGRDTAPLMLIRKEAEIIGDINSFDTLTQIIHNLADFYVWLENFSGGSGKVILHYYNNGSGVDTMNAEATAMRALYNSLSIIPNSTRQSCYNRIKSRFENTILYKTNLPYSVTQSLSLNSLLHYHVFSLFEYISAIDDTPSFDIASYLNQSVQADGKLFELGYNTSARAGFLHTSLYGSYLLYKYGTISSLETACRLVENILGQCYPSGFYVYPLDGWQYQSATNDVPIVVQCAYKPLLELVYS